MLEKGRRDTLRQPQGRTTAAQEGGPGWPADNSPGAVLDGKLGAQGHGVGSLLAVQLHLLRVAHLGKMVARQL